MSSRAQGWSFSVWWWSILFMLAKNFHVRFSARNALNHIYRLYSFGKKRTLTCWAIFAHPFPGPAFDCETIYARVFRVGKQRPRTHTKLFHLLFAANFWHSQSFLYPQEWKVVPLKTFAASFINYGVSFNSKDWNYITCARAQNIPAANCFQARKQIFEINLVPWCTALLFFPVAVSRLVILTLKSRLRIALLSRAAVAKKSAEQEGIFDA